MTLDIIGKVDQFREIFDVDDFKKHKVEAYYKILKTKDGDAKEDNAVFAKDLYRMAMGKGIIPKASMDMYEKHIKNEIKKKRKERIKQIFNIK